MSNFLSTLQLPSEVEKSILGSVLSQVYVFIIDNAQLDSFVTFLEKSGYTNIISKTENDLTAITAQKELVFPEKQIVDENANPDDVPCTSGLTQVYACNSINDQDMCGNYYMEGSTCSCTGIPTEVVICGWNNSNNICSAQTLCSKTPCYCD